MKLLQHKNTIEAFILNGFSRLGVQNIDTALFTVADFRQAYAIGVTRYNRFLRINDGQADLFDAYFGRQNNENNLMAVIRNIYKQYSK